MSQALYRKYRSRSFDEVLGQDHIISILKNALKKGRIAHAYLLTGPRGTGKTSVARILAHEINQLPYEDDKTHLDIIEIDAASNNGVDHIRDLREKARVAPVSAKYKIYIIDEVHMLSKPAFNALLKTLEEPPAHVIFVLATTDADKLPATILSRVQQYYFRPIGQSTISSHLVNIAKKEGFALDKDAADLIAEYARGGFRDSLSLLDQLSSLASKKQPLTKKQVLESLGLSDEMLIDQLLDHSLNNRSQEVVETINQLEEQGADPLITTRQLLSKLRAQLAENPSYTGLMQQLIDVTKHSHPDLKLLTVLLGSQPATTISQSPVTQANPSKVTPQKAIQPKVVEEPKIEYKPEPKVEKPVEPQKPTEPIKPFTGEFNWQSLLDAAKKQSLGLFSLLSQCNHEYKDGSLTLFTGTQFTQKKLDDAKIRPLISEALQTSQGGEISLTITSDKKPPQDEKIAAIAAMMGGGEEVALEDAS